MPSLMSVGGTALGRAQVMSVRARGVQFVHAAHHGAPMVGTICLIVEHTGHPTGSGRRLFRHRCPGPPTQRLQRLAWRLERLSKHRPRPPRGTRQPRPPRCRCLPPLPPRASRPRSVRRLRRGPGPLRAASPLDGRAPGRSRSPRRAPGQSCPSVQALRRQPLPGARGPSSLPEDLRQHTALWRLPRRPGCTSNSLLPIGGPLKHHALHREGRGGGPAAPSGA
mmetsp:Transcript_60215/g.176729  ORF Transcript_60215/g.176729 Transcript_60215/m.176729 type:complete len:223 (+) Transcript_60215:291-959(+)